MAKKLDDRLQRALSDDAAFEELLKASLKPVEPPCDFSSRVMNAIAEEQAQPAPAKVIRFPFRRFALGAASCAAALLLFVAVTAPSAEQPAIPTAKPLQIAEQPLFTAPEPAKVEQPTQTPETTAPRNTDTPNTSDTPEPATPTPAPAAVTAPKPAPVTDPEPPAEVRDGELILPRTAYGTEMKDSLATRLVAEVENSHIYQPGFADKNAVFYTADDVNVYSWRVDLANAGEPQASVQAAKSDLPGIAQLLSATTTPVDNTTLVTSPDNTMLAQNSADGVWISLKDGDVFQLTSESGGRIVAWSPDSSKLLFTNAEGNLFLGYPLEQRIYQISDQKVKDVCWNADNKTLLYVAEGDTQDALYIVTVY